MEQKQTAVEWFAEQIIRKHPIITQYLPNYNFDKEIIQQAKEMEKHQQDTFAIEFAEWYENDVLAKGDYEMIAKDKKELLEIFKETYGKQ